MIAYLSGILRHKNPPYLILDVGGIGFEIAVSLTTFYGLPLEGEKVALWIQAIYREDDQLLFGFAEHQEKETFKAIIKVSGIGAKIALAILSVLGTRELSRAIQEKNIALLTSVPGIGKKTAERLILELTGKLLPSAAGASINMAAPHTEDITQTLIALGYSAKEARFAVADLKPDIDVSEGVKLALQKLTK